METSLPSQQTNQEHQASLSQRSSDRRAPEERFALAIHGASDGWWDRDLRTNTVYFSPRWKQLLGYAENDIPHRFEEWTERVHPDDLERIVTALQQQMDGHAETYEIDHRVRHKDGTYHWIRARGSALRDEHGVVSRLAGWHADITEQKRTEEMQARWAQHATFRADVSMAMTERAALPTILQCCTEAMVHHLHAAFARIWTLRPGEEVLELQASAGRYTHLNGAHSRIPVGALKIGLIARERRPHLTNEVQGDPRVSDKEWARREGMVSFAGYPLLVEDQVVGVMAMFSQEPLLEDTLEALASVAHAIAQGIGRKWAEEQLEERVNERTKELALLLEVSQNIASTLDLKPLLDTILTQLKTVVDYHAAALYALQDDRLTILNYQGEQPLEQIKGLLSLFEQDMTRILRRRQHDLLVIDDIYQQTRLSQRSAEEVGTYPVMESAHLHSWMGVPLMAKDQAIGLLTLSHSQPRYYGRRHANLVRALANQAAVALENARLYGQAQELAALQERQRLARELHDSVTQALYSIALGARTARTLLDHDPSKLAEPLDYVLALAQAGQAEMRALIFELRPESLEIEGLVTALKKQTEALQARHGLRVVIELGKEPLLPFMVKEALYRIAQEALHNSVKHAHATTVELRLRTLATEITLEVIDNGVGFNPKQSFPGHLGVQSMRERVTHLGGTLQITSAPGQGTHIRVMIPQQ
jgi:PAS domain S-box-containing protein